MRLSAGSTSPVSPREAHPSETTLVTDLHAIFDATIHREPGTTDAGLLTGAGAIDAVLAVAAVHVPRLHAGRAARAGG
jgi:hypothetical protein